MLTLNDGDECSILKLSGFQETTYDGYYANGGKTNYGPVAKDFEDFKEQVRNLAKKKNDRLIDTECPEIHEMGAVIATTIDSQPLAEEYLAKLGFQKMGPFSRSKYKKSGGITIWAMHCPKFLDALGLSPTGE